MIDGSKYRINRCMSKVRVSLKGAVKKKRFFFFLEIGEFHSDCQEYDAGKDNLLYFCKQFLEMHLSKKTAVDLFDSETRDPVFRDRVTVLSKTVTLSLHLGK